MAESEIWFVPLRFQPHPDVDDFVRLGHRWEHDDSTDHNLFSTVKLWRVQMHLMNNELFPKFVYIFGSIVVILRFLLDGILFVAFVSVPFSLSGLG